MVDRKAFFRVDSMVESFLATALEDLQSQENEAACVEEREAVDVGTIYDCPDATFWCAVKECAAFRSACPADLLAVAESSLGRIQIGSDLYLERAGHGVGFEDRSYLHDDDGMTGERLASIVNRKTSFEMYVGDDGKAYVS